MSDQFLTYKIFNNKEIAQDYADILRKNNIPYFVEEDSLVFDPSYANNPLNKDYRLNVRQQDFERVNKALEDYYKTQLDLVDKDHYLFTFTDEELQDIIAKPDEWGTFDYLLAQQLLKEHGKEIKPAETELLKQTRIKDLSKPDSIKKSSVILYYIICFFFFPIGLVVGWMLGYSKKTLPNGQRINAYNENAQKHGRRLFAMGIILLVLSIFWRIIVVVFKIEY